MSIKTEIINIRVRVKIDYDPNDPESRKKAIIGAKENVTGIKTCGYPVSIRPLTAKLLKP